VVGKVGAKNGRRYTSLDSFGFGNYQSSCFRFDPSTEVSSSMIVLGLILLIIGYILPLPILITIGAILIVVGLILLLLGAVGRPIGGRRYWY